MPTPGLDLTAPASFWVFPAKSDGFGHPPRHVSLIQLSLICTIMITMGMHEVWAITLLRAFFQGLPASPREALSTTREADNMRFHIHHVRFFSPSTFTPDEGNNAPGVTYRRADGVLESLGSQFHRLEEHRITLICSGSLKLDANGNSFHMIVLEDLTMGSIDEDSVDFLGWKERGFSVMAGENAAHHLLQASLHAALTLWANERSKTLDLLDDLVSTEAEDIMSQTTSERLMFDSSFQRSGIYFKTLQILRIFSQMIQRTRKDLEPMNPQAATFNAPVSKDLPLLNPGTDPMSDNVLLANWAVLWDFYLEREGYLLKRIADKNEEIKSLRDGLFNATALREASQSTTMNRYVIVFTIMTVLYLPPSLVATVFGTQLFDSGDVGENRTRFKISTVVTSICTYILGIFLIWLADRLDLPGAVLQHAMGWWRRATRWRGRGNWRKKLAS